MTRRFRVAAVVPWAVGLGAGLLVLGPALGPGFALRYDMVFVPNPPLSWDVVTGGVGFPRAVPSDAVVGLLGQVLPGEFVQTLLLLAVFMVAAAGVWRIVPGPWPARLAGAVFAVWNPFVAERLLLGQWAFLLGYAGLPWVVAAATRIRAVRDAPPMIVALIPAAIGGFSSILLSGLLAGCALLIRSTRLAMTRVGVVGGALVVVSLPWLVPALRSSAATDPAAVELFAARADTPLGVAGSLLALGGIWNAQAVPLGYDSVVLAGGQLLLSFAALGGWVWLLRRGPRVSYGVALSVAAALGYGIALLGSTNFGQGVLAAMISAWPGFGPLRDGQLYLAPLALLQAVGIAGAAMWLGTPRDGAAGAAHEAASRSFSSPGSTTTALGRVTGIGLALLSVALLPGLAWAAGGALSPVRYSDEWLHVQELVNKDPEPGAVVSLPWTAYRGMDRVDGGHTVVLDPAVKLFDRPVVWNDALRVDTPEGLRIADGEDPWARAVGEVLPPELDGTAADPEGESTASADAPLAPDTLAQDLAALGVRYVLLNEPAMPAEPEAEGDTNENMFTEGSDGFIQVYRGEELVLLRVAGSQPPDSPTGQATESDISGLEVTGWLVTVGTVVWSIAVSRSSWSLGSSTPSSGSRSHRR